MTSGWSRPESVGAVGPSHAWLSFAIDLIKAVAAQLIMWHHFVRAMPVVDAARPTAPNLTRWLARDARAAVYAFLVVGGFLAARQVLAVGAGIGDASVRSWWRGVLDRYLRLALPLAVAMSFTVAVSAVIRSWGVAPELAPSSTLAQWFINALLLQDLLGVPALTVGAWYVAIDLQLFALLTFVTSMGWGAKGASATTTVWPCHVVMTCAIVVASAFYFNRDERWDVTALYFMAPYGLGALAYWGAVACPRAAGSPHHPTTLIWWVAVATVSFSLIVAWRSRLAVALGVALALWFLACSATRFSVSIQRASHGTWAQVRRGVTALGRTSYALFLVHYPVALLVTGILTLWPVAGAAAAWTVLVLTAVLSVAASALFHRLVEQGLVLRCRRGLGRRSPEQGLDMIAK